jgi:phage gp36-like protein
MPTQTYCTRSDLESLWTPSAVLESADDDASGTLSSAEEAHIDWAIESAAAEMNAYLSLRYALSDLVGSAWCRLINAALAVHLLASRQGAAAPTEIDERREAALIALRDIAAGARVVPDAVSQYEAAPTVTNFTTRLYEPHAKVRRVPQTSTGSPPGGGRKSFS